MGKLAGISDQFFQGNTITPDAYARQSLIYSLLLRTYYEQRMAAKKRHAADENELDREDTRRLVALSVALAEFSKRQLGVTREIGRFAKVVNTLQPDQSEQAQVIAALLAAPIPSALGRLPKYGIYRERAAAFHGTVNNPRLVLVRSVSLTRNLKPFFKIAEGTAPHHFFGVLDFASTKIFSHLAWVFFLPRLLTNLAVLSKHVFLIGDIDEEERKLAWQQRFRMQFKRRWFEIGNDLVWCVHNLLAAFVYLGTIAPVGSYIALALYFYDVLMVCLRAAVEIQRLSYVESEYRNKHPDCHEDDAFLLQIKAQYHYELKRLGLSLFNTVGTFAAILMMIPAFTGIPVLTAVATSLLLAVTVGNWIISNWVLKAPGDPNLNNLLIEEPLPSPQSP